MTAPASPPAPASDGARSQSRYQVRFDQGVGGVARIAPGADILIWIDVLPDVAGPSLRDAVEAAPADATVVEAGLVDAAAVAAWVLDEQERRGRRQFVALVAAGGPDGAFAADDLLAAGALSDALAVLGIDDTSPEAAVAASAFTGLRRAVRHLTSASGSGRVAAAREGGSQLVHDAAAVDASTAVRVARSGAIGTAPLDN